MGDISLYLSEIIWKSHESCFIDSFLAVILIQAIDIGLLSKEELHFSNDDLVWKKIISSDDILIKKYQNLLKNRNVLYMLGDINTHDFLIKTKFYGKNPTIKQKDGSLKLLSEVNEEFKRNFLKVKKRNDDGWPVIILGKLRTRDEYFKTLFY
ncbi:unnamed protein product, partial [marine sediment metagenome]